MPKTDCSPNPPGLQVRSIPFVVPSPPKFETVEEERRYRKERLAMALRVFGEHWRARGRVEGVEEVAENVERPEVVSA